nr:MAG TPA: tail collar fiber protein [Caudoviricetes sp.]
MATQGYWKSGAVDSPPDTSSLTSKGYPTSGNPKTGTPATKPGAAWYYLMDQMRNTVIDAAGLTLAEPPSPTQFLEALQSLKWLLEGSVDGKFLKDASILEAKLADKAISTRCLADAAVTAAKLAAGAVTAEKVAANAIAGAALQNAQITFAKLAASIIATEAQVTEGTAKDVLMTPFLTRRMVEAFIPPSVPSGTIIHYAGRTVPSGWLICNGANVSRTDYAALFAAIGTIYGAGNGSTTFGLPNMGGRFLEGTTYTGSVGTYHSAGLPNITGDFRCAKEWTGVPSATGAFTRVREEGRAPGGGDNNGCLIDFYASRVHSIYGSSSSVQPPAMAALILIKS